MAMRRTKGEGSMPVKRKDGRFTCFFTDERTGKRVWVYGKTQVEAAQKRDDALYAQRQGTLILTPAQSVSDYLASWLTTTAAMRVQAPTIKSYRNCLARVTPYIGRIELKSLSAQHITQCYAELSKRLSPTTVRYTHTVLSMALEHAVDWELMRRNPAKLATLPRRKDRRVPPMTWDDLRCILEKLSTYRYYPLYAFLVNTGVRKGEALGLHWSDVNLDLGQIRIRYSLRRVKTPNGSEFELASPKTKNSFRTVPLNGDMVVLLTQHREKQDEERRKAGKEWKEHGLVFCTDKGRPLDPVNATQTFQAALRYQGLPHYRMHDLRHAFATLLFQQKINVKEVSALLGHSSVSITYDIYTHVLPSTQAEAVTALQGLTPLE
jgi:integrase